MLANTATITGRNLRRLVRVPTLLVFATVQPVLFVLLFTYAFGGAIHVPGVARYIDYLLPGIFVLAIGFGASQTGVAIAEDLATGMIDRFRSLPITGAAVLAGRVAADALRNLFVVALMIAVGAAIGFRFHAGPAAALAAVALAVAAGLAFSWLNLLLGLLVRDPESAGLAGLFPVIILFFTSSTLVPVATMPGWLQAFAKANPITVITGAPARPVPRRPGHPARRRSRRMDRRPPGRHRSRRHRPLPPCDQHLTRPRPAALDRAAVRAEMEQARLDFRRLVGDATPADLRRPSDGTRWTNQQLLFHMLFGYLIVRALLVLVRVFGLLPDGASKAFARLLDSARRPFGLINYLGSCAGARIIPPRRMTPMLDHVIAALAQAPATGNRLRPAPRHALPHDLGPVLRRLHDPGGHLPLPHPALPLPPAPAHAQPAT